MKKLAAQLLVTLALVVAVTGVAVPAHADRDSPRQAVEKFWDRVQFGQGSKALLSFKKSCRTPKVRRAVIKMAHDISKLLVDTPFFLGIKAYDEKVNGRKATVTYWVTLTDLDYYEEHVTTIRGQRWVRIGDRWFINC